MSDYSQLTNFTAKDALSAGDAEKIILGADVDAEFGAISTAIATKYDSTDRASTGEAEALSSNTVLLTPSTLNDVLVENGGMLGDIQALADPNADTLLGWDDSAGAVIGFTFTDGLAFGDGVVTLEHLGIEDLEDAGADSLIGWDDSASATAWFTFNEGLEFSGAATIGLTDVAAGVTQPVVITAGTFTFDLSSITEIDIAAVDQAADGIVVSNAGVINVLPMDKVGSKIVAASTLTIDADSEVNVIHVNAGASDYTATIAAEASKNFPIGTEIGFLCESTGTITLAITSDTINSLNSNLTVKASGGGAYIVKTASTVWTLLGDLE